MVKKKLFCDQRARRNLSVTWPTQYQFKHPNLVTHLYLCVCPIQAQFTDAPIISEAKKKHGNRSVPKYVVIESRLKMFFFLQKGGSVSNRVLID